MLTIEFRYLNEIKCFVKSEFTSRVLELCQ